MAEAVSGDYVYRKLDRSGPPVLTTVWEVISDVNDNGRVRIRSTSDPSMTRSVTAATLVRMEDYLA